MHTYKNITHDSVRIFMIYFMYFNIKHDIKIKQQKE